MSGFYSGFNNTATTTTSSTSTSTSAFNNPAIVVDIGSHSTKIGWAGDDYPRAYFRSNIAVQRRRKRNTGVSVDEDSAMMDVDVNVDDDNNNNTSNNTENNNNNNITKGRINKDEKNIKYDYYTRFIEKHDPKTNTYSDGTYEPCTAIDTLSDTTSTGGGGSGLFYQSMNSNYISNENQLLANNSSTSMSLINDELVPDWYDLLQIYINHAYETTLVGCDVKDHPIILSERSYNIPSIRQMITECLFEELNVPAVFIAKDSTLQCYGVGKTSGITIDMGYSGTTVTPVYDGYVESIGIQRSPIGLHAIDTLILQQLDTVYNKTIVQSNKKKNNTSTQQQSSSSRIIPLYQLRTNGNTNVQRGVAFDTLARLAIAQDCRENGAGIAINTTQLESTGIGTTNTSTSKNKKFHAPNILYELPDGTILDITSNDRFRASDYLFGLNLQDTIIDLPNNNSSSSSTSTSTSTTTIAKRRQQLYNKSKNNILNYCTTTSAAVTSLKNFKLNNVTELQGGVFGTNSSSTTTTNNINSLQLHQQDAAAAVGIVTRQQKDDIQQQQLQSKNNLVHPLKQYEKYINWHRSCSNDLQTIAIEQMTTASIGEMVCASAYKCDREQQVSLLGTVIVSGGGSVIGPTEQSIPDLLKECIEQQIHVHTPNWRIKLLTPSTTSERILLNWLGGSILGSLNTFPQMYITQSEYNEWGSAIVNRKCP